MKRRDFIKKTGVLGGSLFTTSALLAGGPLGKLLRKNAFAHGVKGGIDEMALDTIQKIDPRMVKSGANKIGSSLRIRKEVQNARPELELYGRAVAFMRLQPDNPVRPNGWSWMTQARIHNDRCPHNTWGFFPWHREYLCRFEATIRAVLLHLGENEEVAQAWALPYWDWTKNPDIPEAFESIKGLQLPAGLIERNANGRATISRATNIQVITRLLHIKDFAALYGAERGAGSPEAGPHNAVHAAIGAFGSPMGDFMSSNDPVFWTHHCNVDRIWAQLQKINPSFSSAEQLEKALPNLAKLELLSPKTPDSRTGGFYKSDGTPLDPKKDFKITKEVLNTEIMILDGKPAGYKYESFIEIPVTPRSAHLQPNTPNRVLAAARAEKPYTLLAKAFTTDYLPLPRDSFRKTDDGMEFDLVLPDNDDSDSKKGKSRIGKKVRKYLDEYLQSDAQKEKRLEYRYIYRLKLHNLPTELGALMSLSILINGKKIFVTNYAELSPKHRHHATSNEEMAQRHQHLKDYNYVVDFTPVLQELKDLRDEFGFQSLKEFPVRTRMLIEATSYGTDAPVDFSQEEIASMGLKFIINQKMR